ncbi:MAG: hypothetical protein FJ295_09430 [Planctomycetes bacterium]|nr:hypothetical protein [Planctomycetota bacterium]
METPNPADVPNKFSDSPYATAGQPLTGRSSRSSFTAIGWIGIVMGGLGLLTSEMGMAIFEIQPMMLEFQKSMLKSLPPAQREAQIKMQEDIVAAMSDSMIPQMANNIFKFIIEIGLIVGSICVLKRRSRSFAVWAFVGAIVSDLCSAALQIYIQLQMSEVMSKGMQEMMQAQGNANAPDMSGFARMMAMVGAVFGVVIVLGKLGFYAWAISFLNRDSTRQEFEAAD